MTKRFSYTNDEWQALAQAPTQIALAVMGAGSTSPFQVVRELLSVGYALQETSQARGAGELIRELNVETQAQLNELSQQQVETIDLRQAHAQALATCQRVAAIVDAKETAAEALEYKRWLIWLGQRVAAAATEGTQAISDDETAILNEVAVALNLLEPHTTAQTTASTTASATVATSAPQQADGQPKHSRILGPIDVFVIAFQGNRFNGEIAPALAEAVDKGIIRIVDLAFVKKDQDGTVSAFELDQIDNETALVLDPFVDEVSGLLSPDDIQQIGAELEPNSSAAMLVFEHVWAARLKQAILNADGRLVAQLHIPQDKVEQALQERTTEA